MIPCPANCGKSWDAPRGSFPLCITNPCPLRAIRDEMLEDDPAAFFRTSAGPETTQGVCLASGGIQNSLNSLRSGCSAPFKLYNMEGAKSAHTTVTLPDGNQFDFTTTNQMHSEMKAIEWMIDNGFWRVYLGHVVWTHDGTSVTLAQFSTTEPHCGFCTVFLIAAGLPVGRPTRGNHKLASRLNYQLPVELEISPHFIARVLDSGCYCGFPALKRLLNVFMRVPADRWILNIFDLAYVDDHTYVHRDDNLLIVDWALLIDMHKREVI